MKIRKGEIWLEIQTKRSSVWGPLNSDLNKIKNYEKFILFLSVLRFFSQTSHSYLWRLNRRALKKYDEFIKEFF